MASINRTIYPQLSEPKDKFEWRARYDLATSEIALAKEHARGINRVLAFLVLLKTFQNIGYFVEFTQVPKSIVNHVREQLLDNWRGEKAQLWETLRLSEPTLYEYRAVIRDYRGVKIYSAVTRAGLVFELTRAAQTMNSTADLINVGVEWLIKERWELPAFSTLDRVAGHIKQSVNDALFDKVYEAMSSEQKAICRRLLRQAGDGDGVEWTRLKILPGSPTPGNMHELSEHFKWLMTLGEIKGLLAPVPASKIMHFASEALTLPPRELRLGRMGAAKRNTLVLCAIERARIDVRDALGDMLRKRVAMMTINAQEDLEQMRESLRQLNERIVSMMYDVSEAAEVHAEHNGMLGSEVQGLLRDNGGRSTVREQCKVLMTFHDSNYLPFLESHFRNNRQRLFNAIDLLALVSTSEDDASLKLIHYVKAHQTDTTKTVVLEGDEISLNWVPSNWLRFIRAEAEPNKTSKQKSTRNLQRYHRNRLEILAFWTLADELGTGDIAIVDSDRYADYRTQLLSDAECETRLASYCQAAGLPTTAAKFAEHYRTALTQSWDTAIAHIERNPFKLDKNDRPKLPKAPGKSASPSLRKLQDQVTSRMERRTLLQMLCEADQAMKYTRHFGVPSGSNPKLRQAKSRYISTVFCYGTNLRPAQTARHMRGGFSKDDFLYIDRRHMRIENLERASIDLVNGTTHFSLPSLWGTGKRMAGDGTHMPTWSKNLVGEMHIRYGAYGGIAYHFVGDTYAVIFSTFITCGTWEAVYILDAFMKNASQIKPNIIHADTQGQSMPVFALSNLMGVQLMPRIRNWKDKVFYVPQRYFDTGSLDAFVDGVINWDLIRAHHKDFMKVVLSIQAGKILPSTLLRILTSYSSKNKLYVAFRELGRVGRTIFLLRYITDAPLRATITATTNKAESFNALADWIFFGGKGVIAHNDPDDQEKCIKYLDVVANALILSNTAQITRILRELTAEGVPIKKSDVARLSPYFTEHVLRFGEFVIDPDELFANLLENTALPDQIMSQIDWSPPD